jgi:hypothetical protein
MDKFQHTRDIASGYQCTYVGCVVSNGLDDLEDEEFPDLRDAAALELVTFDAERPVSDPDLT